jgi:hypothetical protein
MREQLVGQLGAAVEVLQRAALGLGARLAVTSP